MYMQTFSIPISIHQFIQKLVFIFLYKKEIIWKDCHSKCSGKCKMLLGDGQRAGVTGEARGRGEMYMELYVAWYWRWFSLRIRVRRLCDGHNLRHAVTDHCPITTYRSTVYAMRTRTSSSSVPLPWLPQPLDVSQLISPAKETKES